MSRVLPKPERNRQRKCKLSLSLFWLVARCVVLCGGCLRRPAGTTADRHVGKPCRQAACRRPHCSRNQVQVGPASPCLTTAESLPETDGRTDRDRPTDWLAGWMAESAVFPIRTPRRVGPFDAEERPVYPCLPPPPAPAAAPPIS